ncbi:MAG TPA: PDZ domain-containing protein, partial [Myxococcota bacterium]|nr:PDZ domain-containing protein [Myxococcota bacterium]
MERSKMNKLRLVATSALLVATLCVVAISGGLFALRQSHAETRYEDLALLANVLHHVQEYYVTEVDERKLIEGALKGMLDTLDPHTSFLSADLYKDMQRDTKGEFEGLGIEITKKDGYVTVVSPIDGTPAAKAGIQPGDLIVQIDNKPIMGLSLSEAVDKMRGPIDSKIVLTLRRGKQQPFDVTLTRA